MIILEEALKPLFTKIDLSYVPQNVLQKEDKESTSDEKLLGIQHDLGELYDDLVAANRFDLLLYEAGIELLHSKKEKIPQFEDKLYHFKHRCNCLKKES